MSRREAIQSWLEQHRRRRALLFLLGGVLVLVLSAGAILIVQWILYVLLFFSLGLLSGSLTAVTWVSWGMVGLLFLTEIFVGRKEIETLSVTTGTLCADPQYPFQKRWPRSVPRAGARRARGQRPETVFRQVVLIPGVLTLRSPPQGLSLTSDFRDELGAWIKKNKSADAAPSS
jgi:energy-coupling factor transporter transmembrane protein EcfT